MRDMASRARTGFATLVLVACAAFMGVPATTAMADVPSWANGSLYSLAGAVYTIYSSQGDAQSGANAKATLTTDAQGNTGTAELDPGDYWVVETTVPKGMTQDAGYTRANPHKITIVSDQTVNMQSTDPAQHWSVDVVKRDNESDATEQGDSRLSDGSFRIRAFAGRLSSSKGELEGLTPDVDRTVSSTAGTSVNVPLGTVLITETKTPTGHSDDTTARGVTWAIVQYDGNGSPKVVAGSNDYAIRHSSGSSAGFHVQIGNWVRTRPIRVQKLDSETGSTPQGNNSLAGAKYHVYNKSRGPVWLPTGSTYKRVEVNGLVCDMETDENGQATSPNLPYGTYQVVEYQAPGGMFVDGTPITAVVHPESDKSDDNPVYAAIEQRDTPKKYKLQVRKVDESSVIDKGKPQGDATLAGAIFEVTNRSANPVTFDGQSHKTGEVVTTLRTGKDGYTPIIELPAGDYDVVETQPPMGYKVDASVHSVTLDDEHQSNDGQPNVTTVECLDGGINISSYFSKTISDMTRLANYDASGATFDIYNISANPIKYTSLNEDAHPRNVPVETGNTHTPGHGGWVDTLVTGPDGLTGRTNDLPVGTYGVIESKAPDGVHLYSDTHARNDRGFDQTFTVTIGNDGKAHVSADPVRFDDFPILTTLTITKRDTDIDDTPQGNATLDGATFSVTNQSKYDLPVFDANNHKLRVVKPGERICDDVTVHTTTKTDENGNVSTVCQAIVPVQIPVRSTVRVQETKAPVGYTLNEATYTIDVGVDGRTQNIEVEGNEPL